MRPLALLLSTASLFAADTVSGIWKIEGDVVGNPVNETCTLKQEGTKLTGSCKGQADAVELTGEVDGSTITFKHGGEYEGTQLTVTYSGTLGADGTLKGSIKVDPYDASGDFIARKSD